jgi:DNA-binding CsgD family transcriptional regulator
MAAGRARWVSGMGRTHWSPARDKRLLKLLRAGLSAAEIGERMGTSRNAVIGRSARLRGIIFPSQVRRAEEELALRNARRKEKKRRNEIMLSAMRHALAQRMPRDQVIAKAVKAGLTYQAIGDELGISRQRVHQILIAR